MGPDIELMDDCIDPRNVSAIAYRSSYLTLVSSCLSIFGSSLIILTFILWKDVRQSVARIILLFLAIADLGTGLGYLVSSIGTIIIYEKYNESYVDENWGRSFCAGTSFFNTYFPVVSFFWTGFLAIYFVMALVFKKTHWSRLILVTFNIIAWLVPFVICTVAVSIGVLGGSGSRTSAGWCFVSINGNKRLHYGYEVYLLLEAVCGKGWEMFFTLVVISCYTVIFCVNRKWCHWCQQIRKNTPRFIQPPPLQSESSEGTDYVRISLRATNQVLSQAISRIDWKLLFIPLVFIVLRTPGTYRYFLSMIPACHASNTTCAITKECFNKGANYKVIYLQALFDPLQGFGNAVLFVFFSKTIMRRLYYLFLFRLLFQCKKHVLRRNHEQDTIQDEYSSVTAIKSERSSSFSVRYSPVDNSIKQGVLNSESAQFEGSTNSGSLQFNYGSITESRNHIS